MLVCHHIVQHFFYHVRPYVSSACSVSVFEIELSISLLARNCVFAWYWAFAMFLIQLLAEVRCP